MLRHLAWFPGVVAAAALAACSGGDAPATDFEPIGAVANAEHGSASAGKHLFDNPLPHTNGRSCATCHTESEHTTLLPASVEARLSADPSDPLFDPLDADDPSAPGLQAGYGLGPVALFTGLAMTLLWWSPEVGWRRPA